MPIYINSNIYDKKIETTIANRVNLYLKCKYTLFEYCKLRILNEARDKDTRFDIKFIKSDKKLNNMISDGFRVYLLNLPEEMILESTFDHNQYIFYYDVYWKLWCHTIYPNFKVGINNVSKICEFISRNTYIGMDINCYVDYTLINYLFSLQIHTIDIRNNSIYLCYKNAVSAKAKIKIKTFSQEQNESILSIIIPNVLLFTNGFNAFDTSNICHVQLTDNSYLNILNDDLYVEHTNIDTHNKEDITGLCIDFDKLYNFNYYERKRFEVDVNNALYLFLCQDCLNLILEYIGDKE